MSAADLFREERIAEGLLELAGRAGDAIMDVYARGEIEARRKEDDSPLTEADRVSHRLILEGLRRLTPDVPIVSEEGSPEDRHVPERGSCWLVDPLDGTKEFIKRTGEFTVNIALIVDRRPAGGVVHAPALGKSWVGAGDGAWLLEDSTSTALQVLPITGDRPLAVVASRDHAGPMVAGLLDRLPGAEIVSMGSSLKFCLIAEGRADLYLRDGPTMEWDTAAAQAVLEAAGGGVFTLDGEPLPYGKPELRNPVFVAVGDQAFDWRSRLA